MLIKLYANDAPGSSAYYMAINPNSHTEIVHNLGNGKVFRAVGFLSRMAPEKLALTVCKMANDGASAEQIEEATLIPVQQMIAPGLILLRNGMCILYKPEKHE